MANTATYLKKLGRFIKQVLEFLYFSRPSAFIRKWGIRFCAEVLVILWLLFGIFFLYFKLNPEYALDTTKDIDRFWQAWWVEERSFLSMFKDYRRDFLQHWKLIP